MGKPLRVLMVEDSEDDALLILWQLRDTFEVTHQRVETAESLRTALDEQEWDVVIADYYLPRFNGLGALQLVRLRTLDLPFILVSGVVGEETAVAAMKAGAQDYIMKGSLARLLPAVERELADAQVRRARRDAETQLLRERERIAADLHDRVVQSLFATSLGLASHERRLTEDPNTVETRKVLQRARVQIDEVCKEIRESILDIRPPDGASRSLHAGLDILAQELRSAAPIRVRLDLAAETDDLLEPTDVANVIAVAREATTNVVRHARALQVTILLERMADRLQITIRDDGRGFDTAHPLERAPGQLSGHGLRTMAERASWLYGQLFVTSAPGAGTEVRLQVPIRGCLHSSGFAKSGGSAQVQTSLERSRPNG